MATTDNPLLPHRRKYETDRYIYTTYYNIGLFAKIVKPIYTELSNAGDTCFSFLDVLDIFATYFAEYETKFKREHAHINKKQIRDIIYIIDNIPDRATGDFIPDITVEDYEAMISCHFRTNYHDKTDFNINHFFSGDIRLLRFYEAVYR